MEILFTSDLHLKKNNKKTYYLFIKLYKKYINNVKKIYILGDFFDYWLGYDIDRYFNKEINNIIKLLKKKNIKIYFLKGNRDFLITKLYIKKMNFKLLEDFTVINHNKKNILISHGDYFCKNNIKHKLFRKLSNINLVKYLFLSSNKLIRIYIQKKIKTLSNNVTCNLYYNSLNEIVEKKNIKVIIHGHTHNPNIFTYNLNNKKIKIISLGGWNKKPYILKILLNNQMKFIKIT